MGYVTPTSKKATARDYAEIEAYESGNPVDYSAQNLLKLSRRTLTGEEYGTSGARSYQLETGYKAPTPEAETPEIPREKPISRLEGFVGDSFENKGMFEEGQMASRPSNFNPASNQIEQNPFFSVPNNTIDSDKKNMNSLYNNSLT